MAVDKDLVSVQQARDSAEAAHEAQVKLTRFDQDKIDRICAAMARRALGEALRLGTLAVAETGYGLPEDKAEKNRFAAEDVWNYFRGLRTVGVIAESKDVMEIASPRGVVAAIIPSTNPTSTAIFKCLIAIKSRNAIVLSPHPSATNCISETVGVMREAAIAEGLPPDAIRCLQTATIEGTEALMKHRLTAVILATGGIGLVRSAYSSGKPAFGVGPGNVPVFVERSAAVPKAVADILTGKCFDNGTICASEQAIVVDAAIAGAVRGELTAQGGHFLNAAEADQLGRVVATTQRTLNPAVVGKSVDVIARMVGISIPPGTRCLICEVGGVGRDYPLSMEKLSPILAFYVEEGLEAGAARCFEVLSYGGMGHTAGIHTRSREMAKAFGTEMPASRVVVNTPTTHGAIGFSTALPPSLTLGCGSWGGNVTSDNISPLHLMDIKRVAFETRPVISVARSSAAMSSHSGTAAAAELSAAPTPQGVTREEIARVVDRFLAQRQVAGPAESAAPSSSPPPPPPSSSSPPSSLMHAATSPAPSQPIVDVLAAGGAAQAIEMAQAIEIAGTAPYPEAAPVARGPNSVTPNSTNATAISNNTGGRSSSSGEAQNGSPPPPPASVADAGPGAGSLTVISPAVTNGGTKPAVANNNGAVDFVCEEDVRRAIARGEKIYVTSRTIITPAAHDIGDGAEVFAKV